GPPPRRAGREDSGDGGELMRRVIPVVLLAAVCLSPSFPLSAMRRGGQGERSSLQDTARIVLRAATVLDGRGGVQRNVDILVVGNRIASITTRRAVPVGARLVDLGDRTVLPGLIDAHTHPVWYFNRQNRLHTMTDSQLVAACGEAKALGLRTLVHAHSAAAVRAATLAGCTEIEHGIFVTQDVLTLMAERGTYFDPQCALVFRNYLDNRARYV